MEGLYPSLELCHVTIQDWIVFQRSRFDHIDSNGEPYICQVFLIQIHTGQYVHRVQGQRVDYGLTTDPKALETKLNHAFRSTKPCPGIPFKMESNNPLTQILNLPYPRRVSKTCLQYVDKNMTQPEGFELACTSCQRVCQDLEGCEDQAIKVEDLNLEGVGNDSDGGSSMGLSFSYQSDNEFPPQKLIGKVKPSTEESGISHEGLNNEEHQKKLRQNRARMQRKRRLERLEGISCRVCQKKCKGFSKLLIHTSKNHPAETCLKALAQDKEEIDCMKEPKMCRTCHRFCNGCILLNQHKEVYHELGDFKCVDCQEPSLTFYDLILHSYEKHDKAIEHKTLHTQGLATITHEDGKIEYRRERFACHLCDVSFSTDTGLTFHLRSNHFWDLFECKACDLKCHYAPDISAHVLNFHAENPEIECVYCGEKIAHDMLKEHLDKCKKEYNFKKKHALEYQCNYCGKKYMSGGIFKAHMLQHEGIERYKCSFCDFGSNIKRTVLDHEMSHLRQKGLTNEDTDVVLFHQCDQCGKQFSQKKTLRRHFQRVHEGVKPKYKCSDSDCKFFAYSSSMLYKHKRETHGFVTSPKKRTRFVFTKVQK
ncbi:hypothetical protein TCAL_12060 [Tigriopus californicus]|uniref:C2H2-type domain-containing protein n=2 Tax=Tigriopus californicus TaxID=6832 RepID=A0A553NBT5_TIGCA|nr:hypothetical protein TCAL_12060 [Tigriopus californicus]|eukprot:TCALIF_12060-PA protein Name:"Similar to ZNF7 Zinc finger protein 7 (Homo sapiens)" AED:0.66 eAED:0.66 QI:0/-1/0/1/-1/1/1/0/593